MTEKITFLLFFYGKIIYFYGKIVAFFSFLFLTVAYFAISQFACDFVDFLFTIPDSHGVEGYDNFVSIENVCKGQRRRGRLHKVYFS